MLHFLVRKCFLITENYFSQEDKMKKILDLYAEFLEERLSNGLSVYYIEKDLPWIYLKFCVHSGASDDPEGQEGLAHFVEHLVGENMEAKGKKKDVLQYLKRLGGLGDLGRTNYEATDYSFKIPLRTESLPKTLAVFGKMLLDLELKNRIEEERQTILIELGKHFGSDIAIKFRRLWMQNLFKGHWLSRFLRPLGQPATIKNITRNNLQNFYDHHYVPANISVVGVGGLKKAKLLKLLQQSPFGETKNGSRNLIKPPAEFQAPDPNLRIIQTSDYSSAKISKGYYECGIALPGKINREVMIMVRRMLYEIFSQEFRKKQGWIYDIEVVSNWYQGAYDIIVHGGFSLTALKNNRILSVADKCFEKIVNEKLLERERRSIINESYLSDTSYRGIVDNAANDLGFCHRIKSLQELHDDLRKVSIDDIMQVAEYLKPERRLTFLDVP
jgi:predicted Zn-dependent peptidase